jgi:hypothetical protein
MTYTSFSNQFIKCNYRYVLMIFLLFKAVNCFGQDGTLEDVLKFQSLDSVALKEFALQKNFALLYKKEDNWIYSFNFRSNADKDILFERTVPKNSSGYKLYYHFNKRASYKELKKAMSKNGYVLKKSFETSQNAQLYSNYRERYVKDSLVLELCTTDYGAYYTLLIYPEPKYAY